MGDPQPRPLHLLRDALPARGGGRLTPRLLGLGNELRGDDAAGLLVAREVVALTGARPDVEEVSGGFDRLVEALLGEGRVIAVDAVAGPGPEGEVMELAPDQLARMATPTSHGLGLAEAASIARALGGRATLEVWGIRGRNFQLGDPVSPPVAHACARLAAHLAPLLDDQGKSVHTPLLPARG